MVKNMAVSNLAFLLLYIYGWTWKLPSEGILEVVFGNLLLFPSCLTQHIGMPAPIWFQMDEG